MTSEKICLVIDDHPADLAWMVGRSPALKGCTILEADSHAQAWTLCQKLIEDGRVPDFIVADLLNSNDNSTAQSTFLLLLAEALREGGFENTDGQTTGLYRSPVIVLASNFSFSKIYPIAQGLEQRYPFHFAGFNKLDPELAAFFGDPGVYDERVRQHEMEIAKIFPEMSLAEAMGIIFDSNADFERILRGIRPEDLLAAYAPRLSPTSDQAASAIPFDAGTGLPVAGRAARTFQQATELKQADPAAPVIYAGQETEERIIAHSALLAGVATTCTASDHFGEMLGIHGISAVFRNSSLVLPGDDPFEAVKPGQVITLDPEHAELHPGEVDFLPPAEHSEEFLALIDLIRMRCFSETGGLEVLPRIQTAEDMERAQSDIGLCKLEFCFTQTPEGRQVLEACLFDPCEENCASLQDYLTSYLKKEVVSPAKRGCLYNPAVRLLDFKPELLSDRSREAELKEKFGLDDLRGTELAKAMPEFYSAQVRAVFEALDLDHVHPSFVVPMVRDPDHFDHMRALVGAEAMGRCHSVSPMIETLDGAGIARELAERLADTSFCRLHIGFSDLTGDMTGVGRADWQGIRDWMEENGTQHNPYRTIHPRMVPVLEGIVAAAQRSDGWRVKIRLSGVQTVYPDALERLAAVGINEVTVPAERRYLEGMPVFLALRKYQRSPVPADEFEYQREKTFSSWGPG